MFVPRGTAALEQANALIGFADASGMAVFHVKQMAPPAAPVFAAGTPNAELHPSLVRREHHIVVLKKTISALGGQELHRQLQARGIRTLILCGLLTHMCVSSTARDASDLGYGVIVAADACATRDIAASDGQAIPHDLLHYAALAEIGDAFGEVRQAKEILALPVRATSSA